jgi:hypothetical protein
MVSIWHVAFLWDFSHRLFCFRDCISIFVLTFLTFMALSGCSASFTSTVFPFGFLGAGDDVQLFSLLNVSPKWLSAVYNFCNQLFKFSACFNSIHRQISILRPADLISPAHLFFHRPPPTRPPSDLPYPLAHSHRRVARRWPSARNISGF